MADVLMSNMAHPCLSLNRHNRSWNGCITLGSAAIASQSFPGPITFSRTSAGLYAGVFPKCPKGFIRASVISAVPTVFYAVVIAADYAAGTCSIRTANASGAATDPASGDKLCVYFDGEAR